MAKATSKQQAGTNFDTLFGVRQGERSVSGGFKMLAHNRITVRPQVRRSFPQDDMDELRESIRELRAQNGGIEGTGLLQALLVTPDNGGYRLIAGERRFRATRDEGLPEVPCVVVPAVTDTMARLLQLTENGQRTAPPVLEEANAIRATMDEQKLSLRDTARLLGKTLGYVTNRLNLLKVGEDVRAMVEARPDTLRVAAHIGKVRDADLRAGLIHAVVQEEIGEREVLRRIENAFRPIQHQASEDRAPEGSRNAQSSGTSREELFSRENNSASSGAKEPGIPSLRDALKATNEAVKNLRRAVLSESDRKTAREQADQLRASLDEMDEILG